MGVERGTISLTIDAPMSGHGRDACVSLQVNDADSYYREWRDKVEIKNPPRDEYWGARTFSVTIRQVTIFVIGPTRDAMTMIGSRPAGRMTVCQPARL